MSDSQTKNEGFETPVLWSSLKCPGFWQHSESKVSWGSLLPVPLSRYQSGNATHPTTGTHWWIAFIQVVHIWCLAIIQSLQKQTKVITESSPSFGLSLSLLWMTQSWYRDKGCFFLPPTPKIGEIKDYTDAGGQTQGKGWGIVNKHSQTLQN